jgi:hypothetical protein
MDTDIAEIDGLYLDGAQADLYIAPFTSSFTHLTRISQGEICIDGDMNSSFFTLSSGRLGGSGTLILEPHDGTNHLLPEDHAFETLLNHNGIIRLYRRLLASSRYDHFSIVGNYYHGPGAHIEIALSESESSFFTISKRANLHGGTLTVYLDQIYRNPEHTLIYDNHDSYFHNFPVREDRRTIIRAHQGIMGKFDNLNIFPLDYADKYDIFLRYYFDHIDLVIKAKSRENQ